MIRKKSAAIAPAKSAAPGAEKPRSPLEMLRKKDTAEESATKPASPLDLLKAKPTVNSSPSPQPVAKPTAKKAAAVVPALRRSAATKGPALRTDELRSFYLTTARPYLVGSGRQGRLSEETEATRVFTQMRGALPVELHDTLQTLQVYCEEHRQFSELDRLHRWLHTWLALHIPFSIGLFVLFVVHVVVALRVVPWTFPIRLW